MYSAVTQLDIALLSLTHPWAAGCCHRHQAPQAVHPCLPAALCEGDGQSLLATSLPVTEGCGWSGHPTFAPAFAP